MTKPRIVFMGTPLFAQHMLSALIEADYAVVAAYTQPDKPQGRGRTLQASPVKILASHHGIPVEQPRTLRAPEALEKLASWNADLLIVAAYGLILPPKALACAKIAPLNVHASLLPRWRGAAPIQRAIEHGDPETGICIMRMEAGLDTGPVTHQASMHIASDETAASLHDKLCLLGAQTLLEALQKYPDFLWQDQDPQAVTYAAKLEKSEGICTFEDSAPCWERRIRAFHPWPSVRFNYQGQSFKIIKATADNTPSQAAPGTILAYDPDHLVIACQQGRLHILALQKEGGKALTTDVFFRGHPSLFSIGSLCG